MHISAYIRVLYKSIILNMFCVDVIILLNFAHLTDSCDKVDDALGLCHDYVLHDVPVAVRKRHNCCCLH